MKLSLYICLLLVSIIYSGLCGVAAPSFDISSRERIITLRNQVKRDVDFLNDFEEKRKSELSGQVVMGIVTLKSQYETLKNETEPLVPSSGQPNPNVSTDDQKLKALETRWSNLAVETSLYADTAKNTPQGEDGKVTVRFTLYWNNELIDGWRIGGIGTLYVAGKDIGQEADKLCNESTVPDYAFLSTNFKFESEDKKWIEERLPPGRWRMWTVHPADCSPKQIAPFVVPVSRKPGIEYTSIQLTAPDKKPKYQ